MRRRDVVLLIGGIAAWLPTAQAQQPAKVARIGYLSSSWPDAPFARRMRDAFGQALRDIGYIEGENVSVEDRFAEGKFDRLPDLAAELVQRKVDIIVAAPSPAAVAAKKVTQTVPIIMISVGDPVGLGLVSSLARPGENVTGLSYSVGMETFTKGLELLKETVPDLQQVAVLSNPTNPANTLALRALEGAAGRLAVQLQLFEPRGPQEFDDAFRAMIDGRAGALMVVTDALFLLHAARVAELAAKNGLPSMHGFRESVEAGGLMSYGPDAVNQCRRAAAFVDKILKGANPSDLPVEQPTKFEFVINLKTAQALGLTVPATVLARADEVIE
jgi:putative ABC transport system substrate-binding protein